MSDLIRREDVIKCLQENGWLDDTNIDELIETIPIAYDIDKVIEELNELDVKSITRYKNGNFGNFDGVEYYIKKRNAIEIVKQSGVDDDVCECILLNGHQFLHETSCGDVFDMENGFKFCPYCGKKIKVVK